MSVGNYQDAHPLVNAFVASRLDRLADLISDQGEEMLADAGIEFPARAVSTIRLIGERGGVSTADIAEALGQPHQLVTQRVELLIDARLLSRLPDPNDGRRKILRFTDKGSEQYATLVSRLERVNHALAKLFQENGPDLLQIATLAIQAVGRASLLASRTPQ